MFNFQSMKRAELQSLSKENGLKANLKTEVLIDNLTQHFLGQQSADTQIEVPESVSTSSKQQKLEKQQQQIRSVSIPLTSARKPKELGHVLSNTRDIEEDASEDEMMLGYSEQPLKTVKKVKASTKGKAVAIRHTSPGHRTLESSGTASSSSMTVKDTSPTTKSLIDQLLTTVDTIQRELTSTREAHSNLVEIVTSLPTATLPRSPQAPKLSFRDVSSIFDEKLSELRQEWSNTLDAKFSNIVDEITQLRNSTSDSLTDKIETLSNTTKQEVDAMQSFISESLESLKSELTNKFETSTIKKVTLPLNLASPAHKTQSRLSAVYNAINPFISNASPTLSDAPPPVRTLNSFSSPPDSLNNSLSFAERSEVNISPTATGRTSSIFRSPAKIIATSNFNLESQVIIHQDSIGRTGGKHSRYSDSNDSAISADSPSIANGNRIDLTMGQGQKKRARMSEVTFEEVEENQTETRFEDEDEEGDEEAEDDRESMEESFISNESSFIANTTVSDKRDTIVSTKSGEEPLATEISTSDPTYFSAPSQHSTVKAVAPIAKPSPFKPRKSLPMRALPFPFPNPEPAATTSVAPLGSSSTFNRFSGSKIPPPPTPLSSKTLFGTEIADSRFGDVAETPYAKRASRNSSPAKPKYGNAGRAAWSPFA